MMFLSKLKNLSLRLTSYHFSFLILFNVILLAFYTLLRVYMILKLLLVDKINFFTGKLYIRVEETSRYTLFRVSIPVFLFLGLLAIFWVLERKDFKGIFFELNQKVFLRHNWRWYLLFLVFAFILFSFIPDFLLLIKNHNTFYGFFDADSYISMVMIMLRGDFNANYVPEGGLQFGKYYPTTMPTLILSLLGGKGNLVSIYNLVVSFYVFLIFLNIVMIFINIFEDNKSFLKDLGRFLFIFIFLVLFSRSVMIRDYFNFGPLLQVFTNGLYGVLGGIFLFSSGVFCLSHLAGEEITGIKKNQLLLLVFLLFGTMVAQGYFNLLLFYIPIAGGILTIFLTAKNDLKINLKQFLIFFLSLIVLIGSYFALDIYPDFGVGARQKLIGIVLFLGLSLVLLLYLNRKKNDIFIHWFEKWTGLVIPLMLLLPFLLFFKTAHGIYDNKAVYKIVSLGFPVQIEINDINNTRLLFFALLSLVLFFSSFLFFVLKRFSEGKHKKIFYSAILLLVFASIVLVRSYNPRISSSFSYPSIYSQDQRITYLNNPYVFDKEGIRIGYNGYLVDVAKFFIKQNILDMYFWLVSKTPSRGIYENGLLTRMLAKKGHKLEGSTVMDVQAFAKNIFDIEKQSRVQELTGYQNRFLIIDNNYPQEIIGQMEGSLLFKKVYENKLYKIYRMEFIKRNYVIF